MKFAMLESGSAGNSFVLEYKDTKLMIDCGGTKNYLISTLAKLQLCPQDMDALLLTHGHTDHTSQLKQFKGITAFGTFSTDCLDIHQISTHATFRVKDITITSLPLSHDYPKTVGYKLVCGDETIVYVTDTGYVNEGIFDEIRNADYYIWESNHDPYLLMKTNRPYSTKQRILSSEGHLSNEESSRLLTLLVGEKTKQVILAHISREANTYELVLDTIHKTFEKQGIPMNFQVCVAPQSEMVRGGEEERVLTRCEVVLE